MSEMTDETIAQLVQQGDIDSFGELMHRYEPKLQRYGHKFLARPEDIDDLVQDVFIKVYEHIKSFDPDKRFSPWIYRIAHNIFVNELRRKSKYGFSAFDPDVILPFLPARETADNEVLESELKEQINTLIAALSVKYREVLLLYYFEELSYQEISDVLQIPLTTVGVRMTRARKQLRELYKKTNQNHE